MKFGKRETYAYLNDLHVILSDREKLTNVSMVWKFDVLSRKVNVSSSCI